MTRRAATTQEALRSQAAITWYLVRWIALGAASGALAGVASFVFLEGLDRITEYRVEHGWLVWLLPAGGLLIGLLYSAFGGRAGRGNSLLIDEIHEPTEWVPRRMAPLVLGGTWLTHLFGGSAGREGTAIQMSGSLTDWMSRLLGLRDGDRRLLLIAALGGGFGAVFGVPLAGAVFALEVQAIGRVRYDALVPALTASVVGDLVVGGLGHHHAARPQLVVDLDLALVLKVAVAGLAFGLASAAFIELTHAVNAAAVRWITWAPARPMIGGAALVVLAVLFGREYLGLSLPLAADALAGLHIGWWVFALKIVFSAITLGTAFPGGEVTPLFVVGATLGASLAGLLHLPVVLVAAIGFVSVFGAAANTPLACSIMGAELFGAGVLVPVAVGCVVAYVFSSHRSIYGSQPVVTPKSAAAYRSRLTRRDDR
ncbi:voltage-gated chloride channel family protein [soil metagenome]